MTALTLYESVPHDQIYPAFKVQALVNFAEREGISSETILEGTRLTAESLLSPETLVSLRQIAITFNNIRSALPADGIALRAGRQMRVRNYGMYGFALLCSTTLRKAIEFSIKYRKLATSTVIPSLEEHDGYSSYVFEDIIGVDELYQFNIEFQLGLMLSLTRDATGFKKESTLLDMAKAVHLTFPAPAYLEEYTSMLRAPILFGQERNEIHFPTDLLDLPHPRGNPVAELMAQEMCDSLLSQMNQQGELVQSIINLLMANPSETMTSEEVASRLCMTSRTLRRKLKSQGTSFQTIVDNMRSNLAIEYLTKSRLTIDDIAEKVGFSDAANFRSAFKRWTGKKPSEFRS